jgi:hypothetical protein
LIFAVKKGEQLYAKIHTQTLLFHAVDPVHHHLAGLFCPAVDAGQRL